MSKKENIEELPSQGEVDAVWGAVWESQSRISPKKLFSNRLFIEGFDVYKRFLPKEGRLLEIGAGSGRYGLKIAQHIPSLDVVITDPLDEALQSIRFALDELDLTNVTLENENALELSYEDNTFDVVFADAVLQHVPDYKKVAHELYRVVKPGGVIIVSAVNSRNPFHAFYKRILRWRKKVYEYGHERTFTSHELASLLSDVGCRNVDRDGFYVAYGLYRHKGTLFGAGIGAKMINRIIRVLDVITGRAISRNYGFEVVCVGRK